MASAVPSPVPPPNAPVTKAPVTKAPVTNVPVTNARGANAQGLDPALLEVLACPAEHHAPLRLGSPQDPNAPSLTCTECGRVFPIRDGIPVLLLDEATAGGPPLDSAAGR